MYGTPGSNLFNQAMSIINPQQVRFRKFAGRRQNSQRQFISSFETPFYMKGSVQRVPRTQYVQYGLEFQRNYIKIFASYDLVDLDRDAAGDQFIYSGRIYQLESQGTWRAQDGWALAMAVDIGAAIKNENGQYVFPDEVNNP